MEYNRNWTYDVVGDINKDHIRELLIGRLPYCFTFTKYEGQEPSYETETNDNYGTYPKPLFDWHIIIFRRDDPAYNMQNAVGLGYKRRPVISWVPWENDEILYLRIWHEMLHSMGGSDLNSDMMVKGDRVEFTNWLKIRYPHVVGDFEYNYMAHEHDPKYQRYYYKMLTERLCPTYANKPIVDFSAEPLSGVAPLHVSFTDKTTGYYETREWKIYGPAGLKFFTDKDPSADLEAGVHRVVLSVFDGYDLAYKDVGNYINVEKKPEEPEPEGWFARFVAWIKRLFTR